MTTPLAVNDSSQVQSYLAQQAAGQRDCSADPVEYAIDVIRDRTSNDGFLGTSRNGNMHEINFVLEQLTPAQVSDVISQLSDGELRAWASDINSGGILGAQGLNGAEKNELFAMFAGALDGQQLARVSQAFGSRNEVLALADAVALHAAPEVRADYVLEMATAGLDGNGDSRNYIGLSSHTAGSAEALASARVLGTLSGAQFDRAVNGLSDSQLGQVLDAAQQRSMTVTTGFGYGGGSVTTSSDPAPLVRIIEAAASSNDSHVQGRIFQGGSDAINAIRNDHNMIFSPNVGRNAQIDSIAEAMTGLLQADTTGIVEELEAVIDPSGRALTTYLQEIVNRGDTTVIGEFIVKLQAGNDLSVDPLQYVEAQAIGTSGAPYYQNAQTLGYFAGATIAAIRANTNDARGQADILNNIFGVVSGAIGAVNLPAGVVAAVANGISTEIVNSVTNGVAERNRDIELAFFELSFPRGVDSPRPYSGPAEADYRSTMNTVLLFNP